jgi:Flp pilus assembly protein TadG
MLRSSRHTISRSRHARHRHGQRGQSLVEFAITFPVFVLLVAGMVDLGLALFSNVTVISAAREGARLGVVLPGDTVAVEDRVRAMATGLDLSKLTVTTTCLRPVGSGYGACTGTAWASGDTVRVQVDYDYTMVWPLTFGTQLDLSSAVQMRIE